MKSVWQSLIKLPAFDTLDRNMKTDVLIIGGGIAEREKREEIGESCENSHISIILKRKKSHIGQHRTA